METLRETGCESKDGWELCFRHGMVGPKGPGEEEELVGNWGLGRETGLEDQRPRKNLGEKPSLAPAASGEVAESRLRSGSRDQAKSWHRPGLGRRCLLPGLVFLNGISKVHSPLAGPSWKEDITVNKCTMHLAFAQISTIQLTHDRDPVPTTSISLICLIYPHLLGPSAVTEMNHTCSHLRAFACAVAGAQAPFPYISAAPHCT